MERGRTVLQTFALNNDGRVVHVDEVSRGAECACRCPHCDGPLIARQGEVRGWHFAHRQDAGCEGAVESALHRAAKQLLLDEGGIMLPGLLVTETCKAVGGGCHAGAAMIEPCWVDFDQMLLETAVGSLRPDVIAMQGPSTWLLEVCVHHAVDADKRRHLAALGWPAVEIMIDPQASEAWTPEQLRHQLIDRHDNKRWLHCPDQPMLAERALAAARAQAASSAQPSRSPAAAGKVEPIRHRFRLRGMYVDAVERDFAITVWSSFHPEVTPMVAELCRRLGGSWRRQYRNWVLSHFQREALLDGLAALSGQADPGPR